MQSKAVLISFVSVCLAGNAHAVELNLRKAKAPRPARVAIGAGIGTAGAEAQAAVRVNHRLAVRGGLNILEVGRTQRFDDITYDANASATTGSAFLDVRPFANAFTLTAGGYFGSRQVALQATPQNQCRNRWGEFHARTGG